MTRQELLQRHKMLTDTAVELMQKKNDDYATDGDPFRNFRTFGALGILVRMSDKIARLNNYLERDTFSVNDEGVRDTVLDIINYAVLFDGYEAERKTEAALAESTKEAPELDKCKRA